MHTEKRFMTEAEVEATFGLGKRKLRRHRMRGDGPPWRKVAGQIGQRGGRVLYEVAGVEGWIQSRPAGGEMAEAARP